MYEPSPVSTATSASGFASFMPIAAPPFHPREPAPLVNKALEGAAKGSEGVKIVIAVRQLAERMGASREVLGGRSTPDEISAAAITLDAGISARDLALLRAAAGKRSLTLPLAVLTDLVERGVPIPTATNLMVSLTRSGASDTELTLFRRNVRFDIERGADPSTAALTRARGVMLPENVLRGSRPNS